MGIFGNSSPFDEDIEKATSENNTSEQWGAIMELCDRVTVGGAAAARDVMHSTLRRLAHPDPHVALQAATLLDACVANCGRPFKLEVASRDFEAEFRRIVSRAQPPVAAKLRALLRKWAEGEFRGDAQLDLIPALHSRLRESSSPAPAPASSPAPAPAAASAAAAAERREQDELARAIALSLKEAAPPPATTPSLYPQVGGGQTAAQAQARQVRALYDFEAAEDNELTFLAGELVHVTDSSDPNWWKGYNERGEGLFPANFVTFDLSDPPAHKTSRSGAGKSVQFAGEVGAGPAGAGRDDEEERPSCISESVLDAALAALHDADPEGVGGAGEETLARLERAAAGQGALIDCALERADRRHARLTQLSAELVDALNLYHELMRDPLKPAPHLLPPLSSLPPLPLGGPQPPQPPPQYYSQSNTGAAPQQPR